MLSPFLVSRFCIDEVRLDFNEGLSIITGETGAGKSVMMGALGLLTGDRAGGKLLTREGKSTIEAWFDNVAPSLRAVFEHLDLDWNEGQIIVRRELLGSGRSRAFVNDTPVTLPVLGEIAEQLIDVHSQNTNRLLSDPVHQRRILDLMAGNSALISSYKSHFRKYVELRARLRTLRELRDRHRENREIIEFQLEQLNRLNVKEGELEEIERRFAILSDSEEIRERLTQACQFLDGEESGARALVYDARNLMSSHPEIHERLDNLYIELTDICQTIEDELESIDADPMELTRLTNRMHELYEAELQFKVTGSAGLISLRESLAAQLEGAEGNPAEMKELEEEARALAQTIREEARKLTESRTKAARSEEAAA